MAASVIIAVGRERRTLGLEHEEEWTGRGVSYCSVCDAPLHRGNAVAVVGGGDSAVKGATLLSKYADRVYIIYRREAFNRPEPVNLRRLDEADNVEKIFSTNVVELKGDGGLDSIVLDREHNGTREIDVHGIFIEIGADPRVDLAKHLGVNLNDIEEIVVDKMGRTNVGGLMAAGDVTDASRRPQADHYRRVPGGVGGDRSVRVGECPPDCDAGFRQQLFPSYAEDR